MKKLFTAIRQNDIETVRALLEKKPELIHCTAKQPPKKDDGQSPLQVALKAGSSEIVEYLLDLNADVNFMESEDCCNSWRAPVIHDAIRRAFGESRYNIYDEMMYGGIHVFNSKERADSAYNILKRIIEMGADPNAVDSHGNPCVWIAYGEATQRLPRYHREEKTLGNDRVITPEVTEDFTRIFKLLCDSGMDVNAISAQTETTVKEFFSGEPFFELLKI